MLPVITTVFAVLGDDRFDPTLCTNAFSLTPTKVLIKGESRPYPRPPVPKSEWRLEIERHTLDLNEAVAALLDVLWPRRERILDYISSHGLKTDITCNIRILSERPFYCLNRDTIEKLAFLRAEFGLDIFDFSEK